MSLFYTSTLRHESCIEQPATEHRLVRVRLQDRQGVGCRKKAQRVPERLNTALPVAREPHERCKKNLSNSNANAMEANDGVWRQQWRHDKQRLECYCTCFDMEKDAGMRVIIYIYFLKIMEAMEAS